MKAMNIDDKKRIDWIEDKQADLTYDSRRVIWEVNSENGITYSNSLRAAIDQQINKVDTLA